jgi:hypothetical protein
MSFLYAQYTCVAFQAAGPKKPIPAAGQGDGTFPHLGRKAQAYARASQFMIREILWVRSRGLHWMHFFPYFHYHVCL